MRDKISTSGINSLQPHEVLEYLLYSVVPRKDTNALAHELINTFGSLADVLNADAERLQKVKGMTKNAAIYLSSLPDIFRYFMQDINKTRLKLCGKGKAREFVRTQLYGKKEEEVYLVAVDAKDNLIRCERMSTGSGDKVALPVRDVVDFALRTGAVGVLMAHNHPSGGVNPTDEDMDLTREILYTLDSIGVTLQDHFIVGDKDIYSFADNDILSMMKKEKYIKEGNI